MLILCIESTVGKNLTQYTNLNPLNTLRVINLKWIKIESATKELKYLLQINNSTGKWVNGLLVLNIRVDIISWVLRKLKVIKFRVDEKRKKKNRAKIENWYIFSVRRTDPKLKYGNYSSTYFALFNDNIPKLLEFEIILIILIW